MRILGNNVPKTLSLGLSGYWGVFLVRYFQISRDLIPAAYENEKTR